MDKRTFKTIKNIIHNDMWFDKETVTILITKNIDKQVEVEVQINNYLSSTSFENLVKNQ